MIPVMMHWRPGASTTESSMMGPVKVVSVTRIRFGVELALLEHCVLVAKVLVSPQTRRSVVFLGRILPVCTGVLLGPLQLNDRLVDGVQLVLCYVPSGLWTWVVDGALEVAVVDVLLRHLIA